MTQLVGEEQPNIGLEGVVVGETAISNVIGDEGRLIYRGFDIGELAHLPFAQVVWLVIKGEMPTETEVDALDNWLVQAGQLSARELRVLEQLPRDLHPMLVLQAVTPVVAVQAHGPLASVDSDQLDGLSVAAKISGIVGAWFQLTQHGSFSQPAEVDSVPLGYKFIHQFLQRIHPGVEISDAWLKALSCTQILQLEHGFNAGTFSGRVTASTLAPVQSSLSASLGTLFGKLHGGADQAAVEMAFDIGSPEKAEAYVNQVLANKGKIMGMGHREYKTLDPRAAILKPLAHDLCLGTEHETLMSTLEAVEAACREEFHHRGKDIWANVEFYKGAVFTALGLPPQFFTATFATARVFGYVAHYYEFGQNSRLIRPQAKYVGN